MSKFTYPQILSKVMNGNMVMRESWQQPDTIVENGELTWYPHCIYLSGLVIMEQTEKDRTQPYAPTGPDIMANDWNLV